jgi:polyribonucleotide 5'-hydroxyl-kinase
MLLNWAVRAGRLPIFVDLDVSQNSISLPSTISALAVERTALVDEGFSIDAQLTYHFGYKTASENPVLYRRLISVIKDSINFRSEQITSSILFLNFLIYSLCLVLN